MDSSNSSSSESVNVDNAQPESTSTVPSSLTPADSIRKHPIRTTFFVICVLITSVVVTTAVRIELLNSAAGGPLPLTINSYDGKWYPADIVYVMKSTDHKIGQIRQNLFKHNHPMEEVPELESFVGPPYSVDEQQRLDTAEKNHGLGIALYSWLRSMGIAQYFLAPTAFALCILGYFVFLRWPARLASLTLAGLSGWAIYLMMVREYSVVWYS